MNGRAMLVFGLALTLGRPVAVADESAHVLLRMQSADEDVSIDAELEWEELDSAERVAILRDALQSDLRSLARAAAARLDPATLDARELRRQAVALVGVPDWVLTRSEPGWSFGGSGGALGAPELPAALRTFAAHARWPAVTSARDLHRALDTAHVPALVELLPSEHPAAFRTAAWMLQGVAQLTDEHRAEVLRGTLYVLDRLAWERAVEDLDDGQDTPPAPRLRTLDATAVGPRPSAAFFELAGAVWTDDLSMWEGGFETDLSPPRHWFQRWAADLEPTVDDLERLGQMVDSSDDRRALAWSIGNVARICARTADLQRGREMLGRPGDGGWFTLKGAICAAWLVLLDQPSPWSALQFYVDGKSLAFLRESLRDDELDARVLAEFEEDHAEFVRRLPWEELRWIGDRRAALMAATPADLSSRARASLWLKWGIEFDLPELEFVEARLWLDPSPPAALIRFYTVVAPALLSTRDAHHVVNLLHDVPIEGDQLETDEDSLDLRPILAQLEVVAPDRLRTLLIHWTGREGDTRDFAFRLLALQGVAHDVPGMLASWERGWDEDAWALGRIDDPRVTATLRERLRAANDWEAGRHAAAALAVHHGLHAAIGAGLLHEVVPRDAPYDAEPAATFRALLLRADAAEALLHLARETADESLIALLGLTSSADAHAHLAALREGREDALYWPATVGLALARDAHATQEMRTLFAQNRTWMIDELLEHASALATRREWADWQVERLTDNCCARFQAVELLRRTYPTIPVADAPASPIEQRSLAADWLSAHHAHMRWSAIAGGWLPGPR